MERATELHAIHTTLYEDNNHSEKNYKREPEWEWFQTFFIYLEYKFPKFPVMQKNLEFNATIAIYSEMS